jgi:diacylglycerol O-acyltransferase
MKCHHVMGDGLGITIMFSTLQDNYSPSQYIQTTKVLNSFWRFFLYVMKPLTLTYAFLFFFIWSTDVNCIKTANVKLDGKKNNAICKQFEVDTLKKIGRHFNGATINDIVLSLVSLSIREYMRNHDDMDSNSINMLVPFSLRELPKVVEDHRCENDFSVLCFTLPLCASFKEAIPRVKAQTAGMKNSIYPFGVNALTQLIAWFPGVVGQLVMMWVVSKATVILSNVPGPKDGLNYPGAKGIGFLALIPGLGDLAFGISAVSMLDRVYMAVQADTSYVKDPSELKAIIERNYDELCMLVSQAK